MSSEETSRSRRRSVAGLIVNKHTQFKLAVACSSLLLLPTLITTLTLISDMGVEVMRMGEAGSSGVEIAQFVIDRAYVYGLIIVGVFAFFAAASMVLSLKLSNHLVGPVARLEKQVEEMIKGNYERRRDLRKGDYLKNLGDLLNQLAESLRDSNPKKTR